MLFATVRHRVVRPQRLHVPNEWVVKQALCPSRLCDDVIDEIMIYLKVVNNRANMFSTSWKLSSLDGSDLDDFSDIVSWSCFWNTAGTSGWQLDHPLPVASKGEEVD